MRWAGSTVEICRFRRTGKSLTFTISAYAQQSENDAIVHRKTTNEYFKYSFGPWDCSRTKLFKHRQNPPQYMCATGPGRRYFTRSFRSTGRSSRLNWPVMASVYRRMSQNESTLWAQDIAPKSTGSSSSRHNPVLTLIINPPLIIASLQSVLAPM